MAFSISYTSVTWTAGDTITEAKMDNMVANDQAYDAHAGEGLELDEISTPSTPSANTLRMYAKDRNSVASLHVLDDGGNENPIVIQPGDDLASQIKVLRQTDTTNAYVANQVILTGWGKVAPNSVASINDSVTFGITFDSPPIVIVSFIGALTPGGGDSIDDFTVDASLRDAKGFAVTTTGFTAVIYHTAGTTFGNGTAEYAYSWIAIGTKA